MANEGLRIIGPDKASVQNPAFETFLQLSYLESPVAASLQKYKISLAEVFSVDNAQRENPSLRGGLLIRLEKDSTLPATRTALGEMLNSQLLLTIESLDLDEKRKFKAYLRRLRQGPIGLLANNLVGKRGLVALPLGAEVKIEIPFGDTYTLSNKEIEELPDGKPAWLNRVRGNQRGLAERFLDLNYRLLHKELKSD